MNRRLYLAGKIAAALAGVGLAAFALFLFLRAVDAASPFAAVVALVMAILALLIVAKALEA